MLNFDAAKRAYTTRMHVADGDPLVRCDVHGRAVGWLARGRQYRTGETSADVLNKLRELLSAPGWEPAYAMGYYSCDLGLCALRSRIPDLIPRPSNERILAPQRTGLSLRMSRLAESARRQLHSRFVAVGVINLYIPSADCVYVAPSLIVHYIEAHGYRPPDSFCRAVLDCPPNTQRCYFEAFRSALPRLSPSEFSAWIDQTHERWIESRTLCMARVAELQTSKNESER